MTRDIDVYRRLAADAWTMEIIHTRAVALAILRVNAARTGRLWKIVRVKP